ncbi:uncharacterized protein LOC128199756 [Bicyclus anynana]|uniref:Uncharacterized protein LOC128199756 n=1 Tax=Bicyclus anynana TaxID=110368 RepID=A0ABM3M7A4_BICAN|nr:uncharacterized protein LOC128199756 [Bicyclus anynana]
MSTYLGHLQNFDHKNGEWQIFKGKLTQFFNINSVDDNVKKIGILLTHISDETYRLAANLAYPQQLDSLGYGEVVALLDGHFKLRQCSFADKANFYGASRSPGESLGDWAARLRGLATYCDFGAALETNLVDRFVLGLGSGPERDKLFEQRPSTLTLTRAIELAEQAESAKKGKVVRPEIDAVHVKEEPVFRAEFQGRASRATPFRSGRGAFVNNGDSTRFRDPRCQVCGLKNHQSDKCRYKGYRCKKCGVKGHLKSVCVRDNIGVSAGVYRVEDEPCGVDEACKECKNFNLRFQQLSVEE